MNGNELVECIGEFPTLGSIGAILLSPYLLRERLTNTYRGEESWKDECSK